MNADQLIIMLQKPFEGTPIVIMKSWVKDICTLNNIVELSPHSYQVSELAENGGPNRKYTQTRLLKKKTTKHKNIVHTLLVLNLYLMG